MRNVIHSSVLSVIVRKIQSGDFTHQTNAEGAKSFDVIMRKT